MKGPDGRHDFAGTEHLATLSPAKRWVVYRLLRKGYRRYNSAEGVMWFAYGGVWNFADPCNLIVEVSSLTSNGKATFRMLQAPDVHVTRYLTLSCADGWARLAEFESLFLAVHNVALPDLCSGVPVVGV